MTLHVSRRAFLSGLGVMTALPAIPGYASWNPPLYPPMDLSYFDTPIAPAPADILFGYASITWGGNDRQAIEDIASLGFHGIQLRSNVIKEFGSPAQSRRRTISGWDGSSRKSGNAPPIWESPSDITTTWVHSESVPKKWIKSCKPRTRAMPSWSWTWRTTSRAVAIRQRRLRNTVTVCFSSI